MFSLFKKKVHKNITLAVAVPITKSQFSDFVKRDSDFCSNLRKPNDWEAYSKTAKVLEDELTKIYARGAKIVRCFDRKSFEMLEGSDIIIVVAHHTKHGTIELYDGEMSEMDFVKSFPQGFSGIVDLSSCQSKSLIEIAKFHYPEAHFLGVNANTSLVLKITIIENVIKFMAKNPSLEYFDAYLEVLEMLDRYSAQFAVPKKDSIVFLGEKRESSVFAPSSVSKGQDFIIQLFIYNQIEREEVVKTATMVDEDAVEKNRKKIQIPLSPDDVVQAQLSCSRDDASFQYDKEIQETRFDGDTISFEFIVSVAENCSADAFIGKIKIAVNNKLVGDLSIKVKISSSPVTYDCDYTYSNYNQREEMERESNLLLAKLQSRLSSLKQMYDDAKEKSEQEKIRHLMDVCQTCIDIILEEPIELDDKYKTVFISSTSDMEDYRKIARDQILSCEMHPEMFEVWEQSDTSPCHECCRRVKNSNALFCILGPKYGFIDPAIGLSMTEIEYRAASLFGKDILVYVQNTTFESAQQYEFVKEIREKRLVRFFNSADNLANYSGKELMSLKYSMH